jgi:hypothetical protein
MPWKSFNLLPSKKSLTFRRWSGKVSIVMNNAFAIDAAPRLGVWAFGRLGVWAFGRLGV